ncbi:MAG: DNA primase, partial [Pseudomonadota bacterium]
LSAKRRWRFSWRGDLIAKLREDFAAVGCVGEETAMLIAYLAALSRKLPWPLAVLFCARSGAGKSNLQLLIAELIPPEDLIMHTRVTQYALFYKDENALVHKLLAIDEEEGASEAAYALRSLQSAGYLSITATCTDPQTGKQRAIDYRVNGPTAIFLTTAHPEALDYETRNRFVILTVDESKEQTQRILEKQRWAETMEGLVSSERRLSVLRRHHNAQRLLQPIEVVNPHAERLAYPCDRLILRREQKKYLTLIKAIALLHQHQRPKKKVEATEYIEVSRKDVEIAGELAPLILRRNLDELAPPTRQLLIEIRKLVCAKMKEQGLSQHHALVHRDEIQKAAGYSAWHVRTYIPQLIEFEYLRAVHGRNGKRYFYELLWDGKEEDPAAGMKKCPQ